MSIRCVFPGLRELANAVDRPGRAYITSRTVNGRFLLKNPIRPVPASHHNVVVMKINLSGTAVVYSSLAGGSPEVGLHDQGQLTASRKPRRKSWLQKLARLAEEPGGRRN